MTKYIITEPERKTFVDAKDRQTAARLFIERTGMPEWFFKKHCFIRRAVKADFKEVPACTGSR